MTSFETLTACSMIGGVKQMGEHMHVSLESAETSVELFVRWMNIGNYRYQAGKREEALSAYLQAVQYNPRDDFAFCCLAEVLNSLGRHEEALKASDYAMNLNSISLLAWMGKVEALMKLHHDEQALETCEQ